MTTDQERLIFCANVRYLRDQHGLSKRDMADILRVGVKTITSLEHNTVPPRLSSAVLFRISQHFHVRICELFRPLWK